MKKNSWLTFVGPNFQTMCLLSFILWLMKLSGMSVVVSGIAVPWLVWVLSPFWLIPLAMFFAFAAIFMIWYAIHAVLILIGKER